MFYSIQVTGDHGTAVIATEKLEPAPFGLLVFRENALIRIPTRGSPSDKSGRVPEILETGAQMWTDWWTYEQQPKETKQRVLDMYTEMDCGPAQALRTYLLKKDIARQEEKIDNENYDRSILDHLEEFVKFAMVIRFNSVELYPPNEDGSGPGTDFGHGIFEEACKMNHSCKPNCVWITTQDGAAKEIRALTTIEKGEELTVDYVGCNLQSIPQRRQELLITKGFICECNRCLAKNGDDTRRFSCIHKNTTSCSGVHFVDQPHLSIIPELLPCTQCGAKPSQSCTRDIVKKEQALGEELEELEQAANERRIGDVSARLENLVPPHELHSFAEKCFELQGDLYDFRGEYRSAAESYAKQLNCRIAILGRDYNSQATAFCCERLGDALRHVNMQEAEEAYKRTVRWLQLMRGGHDDPYSKCALTKLLDIQSRLANNDSDILPDQEGLQGIANLPEGPPQIKHPCQVCGNPSNMSACAVEEESYCCDEHKKMHLYLVQEQSLSEKTKNCLGNIACS